MTNPWRGDPFSGNREILRWCQSEVISATADELADLGARMEVRNTEPEMDGLLLLTVVIAVFKLPEVVVRNTAFLTSEEMNPIGTVVMVDPLCDPGVMLTCPQLLYQGLC
jgi:hypothetical protein